MMRAIEDSPRAAEIATLAMSYRRRGAPFSPLAGMFDRLAEIERRLDRVENEIGLRRFLAAGGRMH